MVDALLTVSFRFLFHCSHKDGHLYELDGRKAFPINHGATTADTLLEDACAVIRQYMERDPGEMGFAVTALAAPAPAEE